MDLKKSINFKLTDRTFDFLTRALNYRSANHQVIAGNMVNIDTPGYQPKELLFDQALEQALSKNNLKLKRTDPAHFPPSSRLDQDNFRLIKRQPQPGDSAQSNLDQEMTKMMKNNLLYEASARLMAKKFQALRTVISQGRR